MDQSVKIALASGVLLGGILLALLFRPESPETGPPVPLPPSNTAGDRLVLRKHAPAVSGQSKAPHPSSPYCREGGADGSKPTVLSPVNSTKPPPVLAKDYPGRPVPASTGPKATSRWGTSIGMSLPNAARAEEAVRTHKIVDGDSLESLAQRYLGSTDRFLEIYEANRDVLSNPQILPIAAQLKIPPRGARTERAPGRPSSPEASPGRRPLVPIPRRKGRGVKREE